MQQTIWFSAHNAWTQNNKQSVGYSNGKKYLDGNTVNHAKIQIRAASLKFLIKIQFKEDEEERCVRKSSKKGKFAKKNVNKLG